MAVINTNLTCDLQHAVRVQYLDGNLFSQDVYGNALRVIVMDGDEPATLAGTVSGTAIREDGSTVALTDSRIDENVATVVLPAAAYAVPGVLAITIKISDTNTVTTLAYVVANVYRTSTDTVVDPGTIIPSITTLIEQIAEAVASIPADYSSLWAALAETFNASKSGGYAVGEYVTYDGGLYRFKNAHTGSWSSSDVDAVNLGSGIAKNASDISDLKSALYSYNSMNRIPIRTTGQDTHGITYTSNGDWSYTVSGTADSSGANYSIISGNGKFPEGIGANSTFNLSYNGYSKVKLQLYRYINGSLESGVWKETNGEWDNEEITLGSTVTGLMVRLRVLANTDITTPVTVAPTIMTARSNENLASELEGIRTEYYGKVASSAPSAIKEQFDTLVDESEIDFSEFTLIPYTITAANKWTTGSSVVFRSYVIEIPKHTTSIKITAQSLAGANVAFLKTYSYPPTSGDIPDFADGTSRISISAGEVVGYPVTENMKYLFVNAITSTGTNVLPDSVDVYSPKGGGGTVINYNTYDITVNPTITTDTNGWLQPVDTETTSETGKTDMTSAIMAMLTSTGYCHLAPGIFYVSGNIEMPSNSRIEGCGKGTKIKLLEGEQANTIIMGSGCSIANVWIKGAVTEDESSLDGDITTMARCGIKYATGSVARGCVIESCRISGFSGAGILMQDTGTPVDRGVCISNCFITVCNVGIYIRKNCEFNKITNCTITKNYYGYLNRGGNNDLSNSGLDSNVVNARIDDAEGSNGGHGTITGCSFNHADENHGYGLIIEGTGRMLVSNCNFYYSKIKLEDTNGNVISNCGFGQSTGIEFINGTASMVIGCMMRTASDTPITVTNNSTAKVVNCFDRDGNAITLPA